MLHIYYLFCILLYVLEGHLTKTAVFPQNNNFRLSVIHVNDFHARFEETDIEGSKCTPRKEPCIGGFSRMYFKIMQLLKENSEALLLNAGDNFQGTVWYSFYKWNITQYFFNKIPFDAYTLGNHEFDDGIKGLVPFLKSINAPIVISNMNDSLEPAMHGLWNKSIIIKRSGKKIGIIGVILRNVYKKSKTGKLKFFDESESVNAEAERLVREEGVFTNIVLSHSGYDIEVEMAKKATNKISLIVGGHSHSILGEEFLGFASQTGPDKVYGPYPTVVQGKEGQTVLVTQASAFSRFVGNITIAYNNKGVPICWSGGAIFLNYTEPQDNKINGLINFFKKRVDKKSSEILGSTLVSFDPSLCYVEECILGNFLTDAMVYSQTNYSIPGAWTNASIAIINAGSFRSGISKGEISYADLLTALPFENSIYLGEIQGKYLKEIFEFSSLRFESWCTMNLLQVAGIHVQYNMSRPIGSRIASLKVRCAKCSVPMYEDLDPQKIYKVLMPSFLANGGNGFQVIKKHLKNISKGPTDFEVAERYLRFKSPIFEEIEGRIEILD